MTVPYHVVTALRNYDRDLRFRWSKEKRAFILERKCDKHLLKKPVRYFTDEDGVVRGRLLPEDGDTRIQYRDGYFGIFSVGTPSMQMLDVLFKADTRRQGRYYFDKMDEAYERKQAMRDRQRSSRFEDMGSETYSDLQMAGSREIRDMKKFRTG